MRACARAQQQLPFFFPRSRKLEHSDRLNFLVDRAFIRQWLFQGHLERHVYSKGLNRGNEYARSIENRTQRVVFEWPG